MRTATTVRGNEVRRAAAGALVCALLLLGTAGAYGQSAAAAVRTITDDAGRRVELPAAVAKVVPAGPIAQLFLTTLAPELLAGLSMRPGEAALKYLPRELRGLPVFGQFYGNVSNLNLEALIAAAPDLIIDVGEPKRTIVEDMDSIRRRTGIPTAFVSAASIGEYAAAYRTLGEILGVPAAAEERARFCEEAERAFRPGTPPAGGKRVRLYYGEGPSGLETAPAGTIHSEAFELAGAENVAAIPGSGAAGSNRIGFEQLLLWNPELILMGFGASAATALADPAWRALDAVRAGRVYTIPGLPYGWHGRPPSVNRLVGLYWLRALLHRDPRDLAELPRKIEEFYRLFYRYELKPEETAALMEALR